MCDLGYNVTAEVKSRSKPSVYANSIQVGAINTLSSNEQQANAVYIYNYLSQRGWTMKAIAGLMGNIAKEGVFNPGAWQERHNLSLGYGLLQWDDASVFLDWANLTAEDADNLATNDPQKLMDVELEYLVYSASLTDYSADQRWYPTTGYGSPYRMSYKSFIASTYEPEDLAWVFMASYERPSTDPHINHLEERKLAARTWYNFLLHLSN